jgi:hypothetical protein
MAPRTFAVAASVQDPLTAERLVEVLQEAKLDAFSRAGGAASTAAFAQVQPAFWDILVPGEHFEQAEALIKVELAGIEKDAEANAAAAEEEALSGEHRVGA